jgi:hypothetical protein
MAESRRKSKGFQRLDESTIERRWAEKNAFTVQHDRANYTTSSEAFKSTSPEYPTGLKLFTIILTLGLSMFVVALDNTIIATAIPRITDHFKALDDVGWYGQSRLSQIPPAPVY